MNESKESFGIFRIAHKNGFVYYSENKTKIVQKEIIERIKKLCIPPQWTNVKISNSALSYLQATGIDNKGRTQYIYHPLWVMMTKEEKYSRISHFYKKLPLLFKKIEQVLKETKDPKIDNKQFIICLMFRILGKTYIRIGNDCYAKENKTYGLTTLLKEHITIKGSSIRFHFIGKKGVEQDITFIDSFSAKMLQELMKLKGERLFKTTDLQPIYSTDMNEFLKSIVGDEFTCKDFRTFVSNILFLKILCKKEPPSSLTNAKKTINNCYDEVASKLGHTRDISKKSYVMPIIAKRYIENPTVFINKNPYTLLLKMFE